MLYREGARRITEAIRRSMLREPFEELVEPSTPKQQDNKQFKIQKLQIQINVSQDMKASRSSTKRSSIVQSESSSPKIKQFSQTAHNIVSTQFVDMMQESDKNDPQNFSKTVQLQNQKTDHSQNSDVKPQIVKKEEPPKQQIQEAEVEQQEEEDESQPEKEGNMKIGDIITILIKQIKVKEDEKKQQQEQENLYKGIIYAEGIAFTPIQTIPFYSSGTNAAQQMFYCCLFRVECAAKPSHQDAEMQRSIGESVHFGDFIQLRHIHSKEFISLDLEVQNQVAKEYGCLRVAIKEVGIQLQILSANKLKEIGQLVTYSDHIFFACYYNNAKYFLHCNEKSILELESRVEINASEISTT